MNTMRTCHRKPTSEKLALASLLLILSAAHGQLPLAAADFARTEVVDFHRDIYPLLRQSCLACHNAKEPEAGLNLETYESLLKGGDNGPGVVAKDPDASLILARVTGGEEPLMPPEDNSVGAKALTVEELELLKLWIQQGAPAGNPVHAASIAWQSLSGDLQPINAVAVSPDGRFVACGRGNQAVIYDPSSVREVARLIDPVVAEHTGAAAADLDLIQSIAVSPNGQRIATGGFRTVKLWRQVNRPLALDDSLVRHAAGLVAETSDGSLVALVNAIGDIEIYHGSDHAKLHSLSGHADRVVGLAWTGQGERLLSSDAAGKLIAWDVTAGVQLTSAKAPNSLLPGLAATDDSAMAAAVDSKHRVHLWQLEDSDPSSREQWVLTPIEAPAVASIVDANSVALAAAPEPLLAVATEGGVAVVVAIQSGKIAGRLDHGSPVAGVAFNPTGQELASAAGDGHTRLWDISTGQLIRSWQGDPRANHQLEVADRNVLRQQARVSSLQSQTEGLQQTESKEAEALAKVQEMRDQAAVKLAADVKKQTDAAAALAAAEDALAAARGESEAAAKTAAEAAELAKATAEAAEKLAAELENQQKALADAQQAAANSKQQLANKQQALDAASGVAENAANAVQENLAQVELESRRADELQQRLATARKQANARRAAAVSVAFRADGRWLAVAHSDGRVSAFRPGGSDWVVVDGEPSFQGHLLMTADDKLTVARIDGPPTVWALRSRWELERTIGTPSHSPISDRVTALDFHPHGLALAMGSGPPSRFGEVKILSVETGRVVRDFGQVHSDTVLAVRFAPDGRQLASSAADKTVRVLDLVAGGVIRSLDGHTHHVLSLAWQDNMRTLASGSADMTVKIWDTQTGQQRHTILGFSQEVAGIVFVAETSEVLTACSDGQLRLYNADNGALIRTFNAEGDFLHAVAVAPDGKTVFAGGRDGVLRAWVLKDGRRLPPVDPPTQQAEAAIP